jgi:hypothetical protein
LTLIIDIEAAVVVDVVVVVVVVVCTNHNEEPRGCRKLANARKTRRSRSM